MKWSGYMINWLLDISHFKIKNLIIEGENSFSNFRESVFLVSQS